MKKKAMKFALNSNYLIPNTDSDMRILAKKGLRITKFHVNMLPTIRLLFPEIDVNVIPFKSTKLEPMFDKLEAFVKKRHYKITFADGSIKIRTSNTTDAVRVLSNIENKIRAFFERWGYSVNACHSRLKASCELSIEYAFGKTPVIKLDDLSCEPDFDPAIIELGEYRLLLTIHSDSYVGFSFEHYEFGDWVNVASHSKINVKNIKTSHIIETMVQLLNMQN